MGTGYQFHKGAMTIVTATSSKRETFFNFLFKGCEGIVCIACRHKDSKEFEDHFFEWPNQIPELLEFIGTKEFTHNLWYCPMMFKNPTQGNMRRIKSNVQTCPVAWADLDACSPDRMLIKPSLVIQSSPKRWQALWRFETALEPEIAEDISRRIAYYHAPDGADKTGWDLTQLLRIPFTPNFKYQGKGDPPTVKVTSAEGTEYTIGDFEVYPETSTPVADTFYEMPTEVPLLELVLEQHGLKINQLCRDLIEKTPKEHQWSTDLWKLELMLFEAGLEREEVFTIVRTAKCNKYKRDRRDESLLWKDVCKAWQYVQDATDNVEQIAELKETFTDLLTEDERNWVGDTPTIIEDYIHYSSMASDASPQYHQAGIFTILSSILSGPVQLPTRHGLTPLNLWFLILADTTLTRKSTSMEMATGVLHEIMPDALLATDGSPEGLLHALSTRPGRSSLFRRDEVAGLFEQMAKKDYYAGMAEAFASLYDGQSQKRVLRRETITIHRPRLVFYAAGIKTRVGELLNLGHVESGFLPRFIIITAESDLSKIQPEGPPTYELDARKDLLIARLMDIKRHYHTDVKIVSGTASATTPKIWDAELTADAWARYNALAGTMTKDGHRSTKAVVLIPTYERLARSGLKAACLIAASRKLEVKVIVEEEDIIRAFYYVELWRRYALELLENLEKPFYEKVIDKLQMLVAHEPGIRKGKVMTLLQLKNRDAEELIATAEQRGIIRRDGRGSKVEKLYPIWEPS